MSLETTLQRLGFDPAQLTDQQKQDSILALLGEVVAAIPLGAEAEAIAGEIVNLAKLIPIGRVVQLVEQDLPMLFKQPAEAQAVQVQSDALDAAARVYENEELAKQGK